MSDGPKLTPAMRWRMEEIARLGGELHFPLPTYDMAGRMRDQGVVQIVDKPGRSGWPYTGWHLRLTDLGWSLLPEELQKRKAAG